MSLEKPDDYDIIDKSASLRSFLLECRGVSEVSEPVMREGEKGQYVRLGVSFDDSVDHPDVLFNNEISTSLHHYITADEDWWLTNDMPGYYGVVNAFGLNPNPENTYGSHMY